MAEETKPLREMSNAELATLSNEELGARIRAAYDSAMEPLIPIREQSALELLETHAKALEEENARLRALLTPPETIGHTHEWETVSATGGPRMRCRGCGFLGGAADTLGG